ncbi:NAD(P)/FAD-dependent oxidoreductase [Falsiroseomonas stagni]|uniref:Sarcosine oxidase subunit beta n=1 Tax=Falsiroseomonas stagni DSM 19981 TaxID=1123062 RepID=A0A1I4F1X7_9PROT|nr:FAD-dependent oxidoreductase [Falsiroseomonas stagni]SFL11569.1 sarcosine oxidase subunit beta [Falsiroseomonas stagni DSM 19981]
MTSLTARIAALLDGRTDRPRRIAVVGAGVLGLTTAWALARRGHAVTVLDAGPIPNPEGSSFDEGRIIRHAYGTMEGYAAMMPAAFTAWRALFAETGADRLVPARAIYALREETPWQGAVARSQARHGLGFTAVDPATIPVLNPDGVIRAMEVAGSGMLLAAPILADLVALLPSLGVVLRPCSVVAACPEGGPVLADGTRIPADATLVAAGAGVLRLMPEAARRFGLRASLQTVAYLEPPPGLWEDAPMLLCRLPGHPTGGVYVLPPRAGTRLKIGDYDTSATVSPDAPRDPPRAGRVAALLHAGARAIAGFGAHRVMGARHCLYTMAPEDRFVLQPVAAGVTLASACSGHGFKLAPLMALGLAAGVEGQVTAEHLAFWASGREGEASAATASA